ncbi:MAG: response regulator [Byssovorax sp.]
MNPQASQPPAPRVDILLAEDDDDLRDAMLDTLEDAGYRVAAVANGQEALEWLHAVELLPSLILLDLMMPVMDGWHFREVQSKDAKASHIPVVVLSAMGSHPTIESVEYLKKPTKVAPLLTLVERYCGPARAAE